LIKEISKYWDKKKMDKNNVFGIFLLDKSIKITDIRYIGDF